MQAAAQALNADDLMDVAGGAIARNDAGGCDVCDDKTGKVLASFDSPLDAWDYAKEIGADCHVWFSREEFGRWLSGEIKGWAL